MRKMKMDKLSIMKYENIEPFLSMVEDIPIPHTCTEADKEKAGIPSALTNIT